MSDITSADTVPAAAHDDQGLGLADSVGKWKAGALSIGWRSILIFLPLAVVATAVFYAVSLAERNAVRAYLHEGQRQNVSAALVKMDSYLRTGASDARFLAQEMLLGGRLNFPDSSDELLNLQYNTFMRQKTEYDMLRLLDENGQERVHLTREDDGSITTAPSDQLQNKATRSYFIETVRLPEGAAYVSPLDLNREFGEIELPIRPTIRFAAPVYDRSNAKRGIISLNYHAETLLNAIRARPGSTGDDLWLLNEDGYWLIGPDAASEWAFMYPDRADISFAHLYSAAWSTISGETADAGSFELDGDNYAYISTAQMEIDANADGNLVVRPDWFVVSRLSQEQESAIYLPRRERLAMMWWTVILGLAVISIGAAYNWHRRREADRTIMDLNRRLERDNIALGAVNRELEAFSYSVSHDLRTPLRSIDGFCQALVEDYSDKVDETGQDYLHRVRKAAQRMGVLIDDMLTLSRISKAEVNIKPVDLSAYANEVAEELSLVDPGRKVVWEIEDDLTADCDARLVRILIANLLGNAFKFTGKVEEARIRFGSEIKDGERCFFIGDNGAGFDMRYAEKLFGAFQRLHSANEFAGTGVGLATVQRIVNKHGGRVWAVAAPNEGATFYFTLKGETK